MQDRGVNCRRADDAAYGGTDFEVAVEIAILKEELRELRTEGATLALHLAPPCSSFSRARDRAQSTKLRSASHPEGQLGLDADQRSLVTTANKIALQAFDFAVWAARDLSAVVSMENPSSSYMWLVLERARPRVKVLWQDLKISQCMFGAPYRKDRAGPRRNVNRVTNRLSLPRDPTQGHLIALLADRQPFGTLVLYTAVHTCGKGPTRAAIRRTIFSSSAPPQQLRQRYTPNVSATSLATCW
jgi:hypothetical protein